MKNSLYHDQLASSMFLKEGIEFWKMEKYVHIELIIGLLQYMYNT